MQGGLRRKPVLQRRANRNIGINGRSRFFEERSPNRRVVAQKLIDNLEPHVRRVIRDVSNERRPYG